MTDQKQIFIDELLEIAHDSGANSCVMGRLQAFLQVRISEPAMYCISSDEDTRPVGAPYTLYRLDGITE